MPAPTTTNNRLTASQERAYFAMPDDLQVMPPEVLTDATDDQSATADIGKMAGHCAVFNVRSGNQSPYRDMEFYQMIKPGAFSDVMNDDVRALFNHDANYPFARTTNKTLFFREDEIGLYCEIKPVNNSVSRDLMTNIRSGVVNQMSIGFIVGEDEMNIVYDQDRDIEIVTRSIVKFSNLFDISPVTFPAFEQTDISVQGLDRSAILGAGQFNEGRGMFGSRVECYSSAGLIAEAFRRTGYVRPEEFARSQRERRERERRLNEIEVGV